MFIGNIKVLTGVILMIFLLFGTLIRSVQSYSQNSTHPELTLQIIDFFNTHFNNALPEFSAQVQSFATVLTQGSVNEDNGFRYCNHFYDPTTPLPTTALKNLCGIVGFPDPVSARAWARNRTAQSAAPEGDRTWDQAKESYQSDEIEAALLSLGHVLHLIEDITVPAHARGDTHLPLVDTDSFEALARDITAGRLRVGAKDRERVLGGKTWEEILQESLQGKNPVVWRPLEEIFDKLAGFTQRNFFSDDTMSKYDFPIIVRVEPIRTDDGQLKIFAFGKIDGIPYGLSDLAGLEVKLGEPGAFWDPPPELMIQEGVPIDPSEVPREILILTTEVLFEYWTVLSEVVVRYGAGAMKVFAAEVTTPPVEEVALIGVVPDVFTTDGGIFRISISPKDEEGNLIAGGVTTANFSFDDISVALAAAPTTPVTGGMADVTEVEIIERSAGEPATLVLDFDGSGSMLENDPDRLRVDAGKQLVSFLEPEDQAAVMDFGEGASFGLRDSRLLQDFTSDKALLEAAIDGLTASLSFHGTPLFDSLLDALDVLTEVSALNTTVVVLTDGEDNASSSTPTEVIAQANAQATPVFTIGLGGGVGFPPLQDIARETGGTFAEATDASALNLVFENIGFGIVEGRVIVTGEGRFEPPLTSPDEYVVSGILVTTLGGVSVDTQFSFTVEVMEAGSTISTATRSFQYSIPYTAEQERQRAIEFARGITIRK